MNFKINRLLNYSASLIILLMILIYANYMVITKLNSKKLELNNIKNKFKDISKTEYKEYGYIDILEDIEKFKFIKIDKISQDTNSNIINISLISDKDIQYIDENLNFFKGKENVKKVNYIKLTNDNSDEKRKIFVNIDFAKTK